MMERISRATTGRSGIPLARLTTLKLRGTQVGNLAVGSFLKHCGCKLATLDVADTHFGGLGSIEILLLMLGFTVPGPVGRGRNTSLRKLNLSGLSLPPSEISLLLDHIALCESLQVLNFCQVHSHPQGGGYSELGIGVPGESLGRLLGIVCASGPVEERSESSTGMRHCPAGHRAGVAGPFPYAYERLAISNKVLGGIELDGLWRSCECRRQDFGWYGVRVSRAVRTRSSTFSHPTPLPFPEHGSQRSGPGQICGEWRGWLQRLAGMSKLESQWVQPARGARLGQRRCSGFITEHRPQWNPRDRAG